jgi:hypothetical protein
VDLSAVNGNRESDCGIAHGALLVSFTEAVMADDRARMERERRVLIGVLGDEAFVDVVATIAAFNVVDRVADATGIPLDPLMQAISVEVRAELDLARFASSANTPE